MEKTRLRVTIMPMGTKENQVRDFIRKFWDDSNVTITATAYQLAAFQLKRDFVL
jgi:hypothetical protein